MPYKPVKSSKSATADEFDVIDFDLSCIHCGYNIRGLSRAGCCPECGAPVADSPIRDYLRGSDPNWLNYIARGARYMCFGGLALILALLGTLVSALLLAGGTFGTPLFAALNVTVAVVVPLLFLSGVTLLTRQEPRVALTESPSGWRPLCRWSVILIVAAVLGKWIRRAYFIPLFTGNGAVIFEFAVDWIEFLIACMFVLCLARYCRQLVLRIPNPRLAASFLARGNGFVGCYVVAQILGIVLTVGQTGAAPWSRPAPLPSGVSDLTHIALFATVARSLAWLGVVANVIGMSVAIVQMYRGLKKCVAECDTRD